MIALNIFLKSAKSAKFHCRQIKSNASSVTVHNENCKSKPFKEIGIVGSCNKSGLLQQHRNMLFKRIPYAQPHSWIHQSEKYQRKMFGRYGSDVMDPRTCFATNLDLLDQTEFEQIAYPDLLKDMVNTMNLRHSNKLDKIKQRDVEVSNKLEKLEQWKKELNDKIARKEAETFAAKHRKERLIEEVRRHFGFKVDLRDERFKDMLELKEKEDRKQQKESKRKAKEEKLVSKLVKKNME